MKFFCRDCKQDFEASIPDAISWQHLANKPKNEKDMHIFEFRCEDCAKKNVDKDQKSGKVEGTKQPEFVCRACRSLKN